MLITIHTLQGEQIKNIIIALINVPKILFVKKNLIYLEKINMYNIVHIGRFRHPCVITVLLH